MAKLVKDEAFFKTIHDFLDVHLVSRKGCSKDTQRAYRISLNLLLQYFKEKLGLKFSEIGFAQMTYTNICGFIDWLLDNRRCSASTANLRLTAIRSFAKFASGRDPAKIHMQLELRNVPKPKAASKVVDFLSESALEALLAQPDISKTNGRRDRCYMTLLYDTATRCQELLNLRLCDINFHGKKCEIYVIGKGSKPRWISVSEKATEHLKSYINEAHAEKDQKTSEDYLFVTTIHGVEHQLSSAAIRKAMKKYGEAARIACSEVPRRVHPHQLRHTRAMHLYRAGIPLILVSEYLGHANIDTTKVYAWADTEMKRIAIERITPKGNMEDIPIWQDDEAVIKKLYGLSV